MASGKKEEAASPEIWKTKDTLRTEENSVEMQQNAGYEQPPPIGEDIDNFLEQLNDDELAEFEKFLREEFWEVLPEQSRFEEQIETDFREQFSRDRFHRAMQTLNRYGLEEGLRRLSDEDPQLAEQLEKHLYRDGISQKGDTK